MEIDDGLGKLRQFDTSFITNVIATYPNKEYCLGPYHLWCGQWYTDKRVKVMYPELGRVVGYAVTCTCDLPDPNYEYLKFADVLRAVAAIRKPVILTVKQDMSGGIRCHNGLLDGNIMTAPRSTGCVGVISDGPSKDVDGIRPLQVQYVLSGITTDHGEWVMQSVNTGVEVFRMQVSPGEIIRMDESGTVKFPTFVIDQIIEKAEYLQEFEENRQRGMRKTEGVDELIKIIPGFCDWYIENSIYGILTKVYFGKGQLQQLHTAMRGFGGRILPVYGGGSIHRNDIYDEAVTELHMAGKKYVELLGVGPNPSLTTVEKGVALCRRENVDVVMAIGRGSVIDCVKAVSATVCSTLLPWELVFHPQEIRRVIPVIAVLTIAATGSEIDRITVTTNPDTKEKTDTRNPFPRPRTTILDPTFTFSVDRYQSICGVADIMSHTMESYFVQEDVGLQNRFVEGILKIRMAYGPLVLKEPDNYEARANLMWAAGQVIGDMLKLGHMTQRNVHPIGHPLNASYSVTHSEGLAVLTSHRTEYVLSEDTVDMFARFVREIRQVTKKDPWDMAWEGIECLRSFYKQLRLRLSLGRLGVDGTHFDAVAQDTAKQTMSGFVSLSAEDVKNIYRNSL